MPINSGLQSDSTFQIWLVEDDDAQSELFKILLKTNYPSIPLKIFTNGASVVAAVEDCSPEINPRTTLVLSDLNLPDMSGIEMLTCLGKKVSTSKFRFLLFTQMANPKIVESAYAAGATAFLSKPESLEEYQVLLTSLVNFWSQVIC